MVKSGSSLLLSNGTVLPQIYDLNAMKGTMNSYLKKIEQAFKTEYFQAWKIAPSSASLKKSENCFEPP